MHSCLMVDPFILGGIVLLWWGIFCVNGIVVDLDDRRNLEQILFHGVDIILS